jgi:hypothetical protein
MLFKTLTIIDWKFVPLFSPSDQYYEEVALEGASTLNRYGCTLRTKDQEMINPSRDVPKSTNCRISEGYKQQR